MAASYRGSAGFHSLIHPGSLFSKALVMEGLLTRRSHGRGLESLGSCHCPGPG